MQARIKSEINPFNIIKDYKKSFNKARKMVKSEIVKDSVKFTPFKEGTLARSVIPSSTRDDQYLIWNTPYAKYLYFGELMVDSKTGSPRARFGTKKVKTGRKLKFDKTANRNAGPKWFEEAKKRNIDKWLKIYKKGAER